MGTELTADHYDAAAANPAKYFNLPPSECCLYPVWKTVAAEIPAGARVVDLGCGAGHLAQVAHASGKWITSWYGLDFSLGLVSLANRRRLPERFAFQVLDVVREDWPVSGDVYTATDFLEHVEDDLGVLYRIPFGAIVILSLPPHDHETHVRHFPNIKSAVDRYAQLIDIRKVEIVGPSMVLMGVRG